MLYLVFTAIPFSILLALSLLVEHFTGIHWHKLVAVMALWYACSAQTHLEALKAALAVLVDRVIEHQTKNHNDQDAPG